MATNELYHYGVKGMKWGVRKKAKKAGQAVNRSLDRNIKNGKDKPKTSAAEKINNETENIFRTGSSSTKRMANVKRNRAVRKNNTTLSKMSDDELRRRINRMEMERRYNSLTYTDTENGYDRASRILDTVGDVVAISGGVITIAAMIKAMRRK